MFWERKTPELRNTTNPKGVGAQDCLWGKTHCSDCVKRAGTGEAVAGRSRVAPAAPEVRKAAAQGRGCPSLNCFHTFCLYCGSAAFSQPCSQREQVAKSNGKSVPGATPSSREPSSSSQPHMQQAGASATLSSRWKTNTEGSVPAHAHPLNMKRR